MNRVERYKKRKLKFEQISNTVTIDTKYSQEEINTLLSAKVDTSLTEHCSEIMNEHYKFYFDLFVSEEEAKEFLKQFKNDFNQERFNKLIEDCKNNVIQSIVTPFGIGKYLSVFDKVGGNVDTIHNVREGIYATQEAEDAYNGRAPYNSDEVHGDKSYLIIKKRTTEEQKAGNASDYLTGDKLNKEKSYDLDHIVSAKKIYDDPGRVLAKISVEDLANTETNLKPTTDTNNRSKQDDNMSVFIKRKNENIKKIEELESKNNLSSNENNELIKLKKLSKIDDKKAMEEYHKANVPINKNINKTYYTGDKFKKDLLNTSVSEGLKMGTQQAIGLITHEFFTALFDEILDIYKNGFKNEFDDEAFLTVLKERLQRIIKRLTDKWRDIANAFKDGAISGFISNFGTTIINMFATVGKRLVRVIRESVFSLFKALKILLFPPEGLSFEDAMHEAKKLIVAGIIGALGVYLEQLVDNLIKTTVILEPFTDILTGVLVGTITGLAITMAVYYIDKNKNDKDAMEEMFNQTNQGIENVKKLLLELEY